MPAWSYFGVETWAAFSRTADLGNGRIVYPIEGIGGMLFILSAAIAFRLSPRRPLSVAIPIYGAALMAVCVLLITTQAAPIMLSIRRIGNDPAGLQRSFEGFNRWDSIRAVFAALGCCAKVWTLVALLSVSSGNEELPKNLLNPPAQL